MDNEKIKVILDRSSNSVELIILSDIVAGMSSMFLIEATIIGKPVISILIGLHKDRESPFILDRRGITKSVREESELIKVLNGLIVEGKKAKCSFEYVKNPVSNIVMFMEKYLCQN